MSFITLTLGPQNNVTLAVIEIPAVNTDDIKQATKTTKRGKAGGKMVLVQIL